MTNLARGQFALIIGITSISFTLGVLIERSIWENSNMGDLCAKGVHEWSCYVHQECTMHSSYCFDKLEPVK